MKPQYRRRFDWDEARRLYAEGVPVVAIARRLGVTAAAVTRVVKPGEMQRMNERSRAWQMSGVCPSCGGRMTKHLQRQGRMCAVCTAAARATTVRGDELWCSGCKQWKPDEEFPRDRNSTARRNRHSYCTKCGTAMRRKWREAHYEKERETWRRYQKRQRKLREQIKLAQAEQAKINLAAALERQP